MSSFRTGSIISVTASFLLTGLLLRPARAYS